jgi:hypothetical protein
MNNELPKILRTPEEYWAEYSEVQVSIRAIDEQMFRLQQQKYALECITHHIRTDAAQVGLHL